MKKIILFALAAHGKGISGGDRIFIEFTKRWSNENPMSLYVWEEGLQMCKRQHLTDQRLSFFVSYLKKWSKFGFLVCYFIRILESLKLGLSIRLDNDQSTIVYSASEFWMDLIPAFLLKIRFPEIIWLASWYQTAPKPWIGFQESGTRDESYKLNAFFYWLTQVISKPLIAKFSNFVLVNNETERANFIDKDRKKEVIVVFGGVNVKDIEIYKRKHRSTEKIYDVVFQGRLHPQKGILELIDIWRLVVDKKREAKLAVIGDGPLMSIVKDKIIKLNLEKNIRLLGYLFDGPKKYKVFSESKIIVHPSFYDSGGMAAAEGMAFGLPCIGFDLKAYLSYYPKGMIKIKLGDIEAFAEEIIRMLDHSDYQNQIGREALEMVKQDWDWNKRANNVLSKILNQIQTFF